MVGEMLAAMGLTDGATLFNVQALEAEMQEEYVDWLRQLGSVDNPPATRVRLVAAKMRAKSKPAAPTLLGGGTTGAGGGATTGTKGAKEKVLRAAGKHRFLEIMADAKRLSDHGKHKEAMQMMFTGKSERHPAGAPDRLAIKCAWGIIEPADLDTDMRYAWISTCVANGGEYLAFMVTQHIVRDGDLEDEDVKQVRIDALWAAAREAGKEWKEKIDLYSMLLQLIYEAVHGKISKAHAAGEIYADPLLNHQLPTNAGGRVRGSHRRFGAQRSGEGSLRHCIESSNQTVALLGGRDTGATLELMRC
jgi:hypothetical protein